MNLLDTDSTTLYLAGQSRINERARRAGGFAITTVTRIEILQGRFASILKAENGAQLLRAQHWLEQSELFLADVIILPFNDAAAIEFDRLRQDRKLKKIGRADVLIASIALAHRAFLITRNLRHFQQVPGLRIENWAD